MALPLLLTNQQLAHHAGRTIIVWMRADEEHRDRVVLGHLQNARLLELIDVAGAHGFPTLSVTPHMVLARSSATSTRRRCAGGSMTRVCGSR